MHWHLGILVVDVSGRNGIMSTLLLQALWSPSAQGSMI